MKLNAYQCFKEKTENNLSDEDYKKLLFKNGIIKSNAKEEAKELVERFYSNSEFLFKINKPNRMLLAKTSAIIHVKLLIELLIYRYDNEDFTGKPYFENLIKEIDKL
jgi:hypothetical protein